MVFQSTSIRQFVVSIVRLGVVFSPCSLQVTGNSASWRDQPFAVIWNDVHYGRCWADFGIYINLTAYGIASPANNSVIFYHNALGLYPYVNNSHLYHGGVPQLVNLSLHLEKAATDIITRIPDVDYSGLAVIDWEFWQPVWDAEAHYNGMNIYKNISIGLVRSRHPDWDNTQVEKVARLEFEQAAKSLFESTILMARQLRPRALWGFYHFPYCFYQYPAETCSKGGIKAGDQMQWLYDQVATLYPSIYLNGNKQGRLEYPVPFVEAVFGEAFRVRNNSQHPLTPVFSYCTYRYPNTNRTLTPEHLRDTILLSAKRGVSGAVIWISDSETGSRENCLQQQRYLDTTLGPLVKTTIDAASRCSQSLCSGHGRCVGEILTCAKTAPSFEPECKNGGERAPSDTSHQKLVLEWTHSRSSSVTEICSCQCYEGWIGENCEKSD